jgi:hypothetical protein
LPPPDDGGLGDIRISFVYPSKPPEPVDVMPPQPATGYAPGAPADYSKPALPAPPERVKTEFGIVEQPRSIFDRGKSTDWLK